MFQTNYLFLKLWDLGKCVDRIFGVQYLQRGWNHWSCVSQPFENYHVSTGYANSGQTSWAVVPF